MIFFALVYCLFGNVTIWSGNLRRRAHNISVKRADLRRRHRRVLRSRNRHQVLHPVMQGTAGFFSTVNTRETNWILTEQETRGYQEEKV